MTSQQKSAVNVVFGAMTFGAEGSEQARVNDLSTCSEILDIFQAHGHNEVDTARFYGAGSSEKYLGDLEWQKRGIVMDTKFYPTAGRNMPMKNPSIPEGGWRHTAAHIDENIAASYSALRTETVDMWYLHGPDRTTPFAETLAHVDSLYRQGRFKRFGISNFMAWEVAQICELCRANGWVMPSVYQGIYNALFRTVEEELFPCLRHYNIAFYAYNPLGGGYLTDRYHREDQEHEAGSRFDPKRGQGQMYRARYWNDAYFDALDILRPVAKEHGLTEAECALRWLTHHSQLKRDKADAIIIGASSIGHMKQNMADLEKGPLPEHVVKALDEGRDRVRGISWRYWH